MSTLKGDIPSLPIERSGLEYCCELLNVISTEYQKPLKRRPGYEGIVAITSPDTVHLSYNNIEKDLTETLETISFSEAKEIDISIVRKAFQFLFNKSVEKEGYKLTGSTIRHFLSGKYDNFSYIGLFVIYRLFQDQFAKKNSPSITQDLLYRCKKYALENFLNEFCRQSPWFVLKTFEYNYCPKAPVSHRVKSLGQAIYHLKTFDLLESNSDLVNKALSKLRASLTHSGPAYQFTSELSIPAEIKPVAMLKDIADSRYDHCGFARVMDMIEREALILDAMGLADDDKLGGYINIAMDKFIELESNTPLPL
ncbi:hypothetical protein EOPP23_06840 [Endozoicomonas sp. OPT23]|uniref:hypothetical protein n=1 Tax=Endozoicomonas sp. OPT23 TaxID=2072845 RepID=UPI00129A1621|nr:hypothetical protein [Endozoicomonas sp. OPT23]MRI32702.1 hypothetical protein [Endozoicomonas sp. OPT23]